MVERHMRKIEGHLESLEAFRRGALAEGDEKRAARAEQAIIGLEQQAATLLAQLAHDGTDAEDSEGGPVRSERAAMLRKHILAINGDPDFLNLIRSLLQDERFNVTTTNFVPESFDQIAALVPALLIVDLVLGDRAGWDLLERLQLEAVTRGIPVIAVSQDEEQLTRARWDEGRYGAQRVLRRPLDLHALLDTIDELIGTA